MHGAHASHLGLGGSVLPHAIPFRGDGRESETVPCGPVPRYGGARSRMAIGCCSRAVVGLRHFTRTI
jgi:hypothetical protein